MASSLVSYRLPIRPIAISLTGQCTGALVNEDGQLFLFGLDARSGQVVLMQRWLKGPLALTSETRPHKAVRTCLARNAAVCAALYSDRTVWVSREETDGPRELLCGRGAMGIAAVSPRGIYAALEHPTEGLRVVDLSNDLVVTAIPGATCADFSDEDTLVYAQPSFDSKTATCDGYEIKVLQHFADFQQAAPVTSRCTEAFEPINLHARTVTGGETCICVTVVKVFEGDAINTRVVVLRHCGNELKVESERAYRDFVAEAMPLPDNSLAVHWPARGGFLLQQASRAYPLATTEPVQRGSVVAWAAEDSFFLIDYAAQHHAL